jgi:hypothetical protein
MERERRSSGDVEHMEPSEFMTASTDPPDPLAAARERRGLTLELDEFAIAALKDEARELNVSVEELGSFALLYFIADRDSGRTARRLPRRETDGAKRTTGGLRAR